MAIKTRRVDVEGTTFDVPENIDRVRQGKARAWVVRYNGHHLRFRDDSLTPAQSLADSIDGLINCILTLPAPTNLRKNRRKGKPADLPDGISGPLEKKPSVDLPYAYFSVVVPIFGEKPTYKSVYIGNIQTYSLELRAFALAEAVAIRIEAKEAYCQTATSARQSQVPELKEMRNALLSRSRTLKG